MVARRKNTDDATDEKPTQGDLTHDLSNAQGLLMSTVERVERLSEEIEGLGDDRKEVFAEAKASGLDTATIRKVIARRKMDAATRDENDSLLEVYEEAIRKAEKAQLAKSEADAT